MCPVKDVWSRRIVGYSIDDRMTADLTVSALNNAVAMRGACGTIVHSDRGSQFRSRHYVTALTRHGKNVLDRQRWATRDELRIAIICWIERKYHRQRHQRQLGCLTPIEYEILNQQKVKAT